MSNVTIAAKVVAKKDSIAAVRAELLKLIPPTRQESGCIEYTLHQDNSDPAVFLFYETWESAAAIEKHLKSDHYVAYAKALEGLLEDKLVLKMTRIG